MNLKNPEKIKIRFYHAGSVLFALVGHVLAGPFSHILSGLRKVLTGLDEQLCDSLTKKLFLLSFREQKFV